MGVSSVMRKESSTSLRGLEEDGEHAERLEVDAVELEGVAEAIHAREQIQDQVEHRGWRLREWKGGLRRRGR